MTNVELFKIKLKSKVPYNTVYNINIVYNNIASKIIIQKANPKFKRDPISFRLLIRNFGTMYMQIYAVTGLDLKNSLRGVVFESHLRTSIMSSVDSSNQSQYQSPNVQTPNHRIILNG